MLTWPSTLPQQPLIKDYTEEPQSQVIRTGMDAGPKKTRRRFTAAPVDVPPLQYIMTPEQKIIFESWFNNDIQGGSLPFDWPRPRSGTASVMIVGEPPYRFQTFGRNWMLTVSLEIQP